MSNDVPGDLRYLIPFYLAGTLDVSERQEVEEALASHPEWQEDVRFWRAASKAARRQAAYLADGHPTSELLVDYAEGQLNDRPQELAAVESHLATCVACRSDLKRTRKVGMSVGGPLRWRTLGVAAAILIVGATVLTWLNPEPPRTVQVQLKAAATVRSPGGTEPAKLVVTDVTDSVALRMGIPASGLTVTDYSVLIRRSIDEVAFDYVGPVLLESVDGTDWLSIRVTRHPYFTVPGHYEIVITEEVADLPNVLPESYTLPLLILEAD